MFPKMERMDHTQFMKELRIKESRATTRKGYLPIGGGALNASYTCVVVMVKEEKYSTALHLKLKNNHKIKHTTDGDAILTKEAV